MDPFKPRYLEDPIREDLENKMVFVGGPRQVGKTTLARRIAGNWSNTAYFSGMQNQERQEFYCPKLLQAEIGITAVLPGHA